MAQSTAAANWSPLGTTFYRKQSIYSMQWSLASLDDYIVTPARWGGPLAIMRNDKKPVLLGKLQLGKPKISVYSTSGGLLQTISWDSPSRIVSLGWTLNESLVVLTQDGTYRLYPLSTTSIAAPNSQHTLGTDAQEAGVLEAKIYEEGMVVLLGNLMFVEVRGWTDPAEDGLGGGGKVTMLANPGLTEPPSCWCVLTPELSYTRAVEVLIGTGSTILRLDEIEVQDQRIARGPFLSIIPSPNGRFLSLLSHPTNASLQLWVTSADFTRSLSEFSLGSEVSGEAEGVLPGQIAWCGNNTVVVAWEGTTVMVGPFGETLKYFYNDPVHLVGEIDGTRIISSESCDFLQIVPQSSQDVFLPGSASPAALLFEASELFDKKNPKADENIRSIRSELVAAVDGCIDAAGREFEVFWQKKLLKAATFGKTFIDLYNPTDFVQMTQTLRILNAARFYEIGLPLTYDQYQTYPASHLIARLTSRSQHLLALRISEFLHLSPAPVLRHWAKSKIASAKGGAEDEEVCRIIVDKLKDQIDVSCADVAQTAWTSGQIGLATKLLDHEPRASKQVPLLLNMKEDDLALVKAIESGDPNLIYTVLLHLSRTKARGDFFRFVDNKPDAAALLKVFAKENDKEMLRDFYYQDDRRMEAAVLALEESTNISDFGDKVAKVRVAAKSFADDKDCTFEAKMIEDQIKLLAFQQTLEQESQGKVFVGLSVNGTIRSSLLAGLAKKADKVRSDFKVPDKRFWYIKMKTLVELRAWDDLETFAKSKKSPIGYEPFVEHLIQCACLRQAVSFVEKCEVKNRIALYEKCGEWVMAGQECVRRADRGRLNDLLQRSPNTVITAQLEQLVEELQRGGV